ncbi:MAG: AAA family ATPase [Oscillospiraceae bacterium]|nr:AAA family ATPase [Oscillospiraceae bacterium]
MNKVILICGKICSGKTHYCKMLMSSSTAVLLSCDELLTSIASKDLGEDHDNLLSHIKTYLLKKACDVVSAGADVILDWGFWSRTERNTVSNYFSEKQISFEWHYVDIAYDEWIQNIKTRNLEVTSGLVSAYYIDSGLLSKHNSLFEKPSTQEIDIWYNNHRNQ